jgi:hypothetical protein
VACSARVMMGLKLYGANYFPLASHSAIIDPRMHHGSTTRSVSFIVFHKLTHCATRGRSMARSTLAAEAQRRAAHTVFPGLFRTMDKNECPFGLPETPSPAS